MKTYYVATLARYVIVEAKDEHAAREAGHAALHDLYADLRERLGKSDNLEPSFLSRATVATRTPGTKSTSPGTTAAR